MSQLTKNISLLKLPSASVAIEAVLILVEVHHFTYNLTLCDQVMGQIHICICTLSDTTLSY